MNKLTADKCREQFEEWLTSLPGFEAADIEKREDGKYNYVETEWCWKSWQASRDALPILEKQEPGEDEWIQWGGGECPVGRDTQVDVKFSGAWGGIRRAGCLFWSHDCGDSDIIAYRIIPENSDEN